MKTDIYERDSNYRYFLAAQGLRVLLCGASYDIFSKDVYYQQSCYLNYAHPKQSSTQDESSTLEKENDVMEGFLFKLRIKVIRAYLLNEFLEDIKILSEENGLQEPVLKNTTTLKRKILEKYGDDISFFPKGKFP